MTKITRSGDIGGTFGYLAPDQILYFKEARPSFDIFSLGATFYHMLCGELVYPFTRFSDPIATILKKEPIPIRERDGSLPKSIAGVIDKACCRDPLQRFQNMTQFKNALAGCI